MSKLEVRSVTNLDGETDLELGESGGTVTLATGATAVGFGGESPIKAWVNFNGTGTVAIKDSMNVSSVTDNGTGDYIINFTVAMSDTNYATAFGSDDDSVSPSIVYEKGGSRTVSSVQIYTIIGHSAYGGGTGGAANRDFPEISVIIIGN